ncbi:MFS transporter [Halosquirtibacter xylanolyticus]|uniref:MFS transporter n=1 Tax=Halosquirtibacter xylanolyticus TaxID=3374599 RepID=UPI003747C829|nr:MFS transporter [Prolixibacteraceae bacterium]
MSQNKKSPLSWVPSTYFAMGLPFIVINQTAALMYKDLGISDAEITKWTSLIILPWSLKFLISPLLEMAKSKRVFVVLTQLITAVMFYMVASVLGMNSFFAVSISMLAVVGLSGATHDIAADGLYIESLSSSQQAEYIGWQGAFYNIAKIVSTGGFVYLAGELGKSMGVVRGWAIVMATLGVLMMLLGIYHIKALPNPINKDQKKAKEGFTILVDVIKTFFQKKHIFYYIIFIILYRFAEGFAIKMAPLFLKASRDVGGLGLSTSQMGTIYGTMGAAAFVIGSLLAGKYISKKGLKKTLFQLVLIFNIPFAVYFVLAHFQPESLTWISIAVIFEYFGYGFGFVGLTLFMMQQIAPGKYKMAHYAFATSIMNLGVMIPSYISGELSDWLGYEMFFGWVVIATIPSILITKFVPFGTKEETIES